jgi:hypothetical protein
MLGQILSGAGSLLNVIGAFGAKNAAIDNLNAVKSNNAKQMADFGKLSESLVSQVGKMSTYKSDTSGYKKVQSLAEMQSRTAGTAPVAGQALAEENARRTMSNAIGAMSRSARSSTDILTSILAGTEGTNDALRSIDASAMEIRAGQRDRAAQNLLSTGESLASATERGGLQEFESIANKERTSLNLNQNLGQTRLNLQQQQFEAERNAANELAKAKAAIWSGFGSMLGAAGQGVAQTEMMKSNMDFIKGLTADPTGKFATISGALNTANQLGMGIGGTGTPSYQQGLGQYTTVGGNMPLSLNFFKRG